jgi:hypothetical protein
MNKFANQPTTGPAQQAGNILKAWICQDSISLRKELQRGLELCSASDANGLDDEHLELLQTVVERLNASAVPRGPESADPVVRLCIDLLLHLSNTGPAWSGFTTESEVPMISRC